MSVYHPLCVNDKFGSSIYYPERIPRRRDNKKSFICKSVVGAACFAVGCFYYEDPALYLATSFGFLFVKELIERICLIPEEIEHLKSRYHNSYLKLLSKIFELKPFFIIAAVVAFVTIYLKHKPEKWDIWNTGFIPTFMCVIGTNLMLSHWKQDSCSLKTSRTLEELGGLDYGSGMAYSFFYGYLNLVLPKTGTEEKDLSELLELFESSQHVTFEIKKLFILIPLSGYCPTSLQDSRNPTIEEARSLEEKQISVAAVKDRVYKNSVYKIRDLETNKKKYICAEYATPVNTFYKGMKSSGKYSGNYQTHAKEIILNFYLTLKMILAENKSCTDLCELILFDDELPERPGVPPDVGKILLARMEQIKNYSEYS